MKKLNWQEYNDLEDEFVYRVNKRVALAKGHCTQESATRQELGDLMSKFELVNSTTIYFLANMDGKVRINITSEDVDPKDSCYSYRRFVK